MTTDVARPGCGALFIHKPDCRGGQDRTTAALYALVDAIAPLMERDYDGEVEPVRAAWERAQVVLNGI